MQRKNPALVASLSVGLTALLLACGGGGGSTASTPTPQTLSGVAATGAAFEGATITVTDKTGAVVGSSTAVGADGKFSITLSAKAQAPFVLSASRTNADGAVESLVSVVPTAAGSATVNISPVTHLIASRLSSSGDPAKLASEVAAGTSTVSSSSVAAKVAEVQTVLASVLSEAGATGVDPLTGTFAADGTGYDRMLDAIQVTITPASATGTNIEIGVKQQQADGAAPNVVSFASQDASVPALPAIAAGSLPASGTSALIAAQLAQLTACYALPTSTRVDSTVTNGLATGTAANVVAPACRSAFVGDDPGTFFSNGASVGRDANNNGAFASLFRDGATGLVFSQGSYEFTRANGDMVVGYKTRDASGNENYDTFALRKDTDNKLKLIGNRYAYAGAVVAYQQLREFVKQAGENFYSTGYDLRVPLITGVTYVEVTPPSGATITLIPGADSMVLPKRGLSSPLVASGTTYVRLRSEYAASSGVPSAHPSTLESGLFFVNTDFTEAALAAIPNQAVWKFDYYSGGTNNATGGTLLATQHYKTRVRASTIAELRSQTWANLSATSLADIVTRYSANNGSSTSYSTLPPASSLSPAWEVPAGALPPTQVKLFGTALYFDYAAGAAAPTTKAGNTGFTSTTNSASYTSGRTNFNDGQSVGSTLRSATLACANGAVDVNNMGEKHCASSGAGYLSTARQLGLHLWARDPRGREFVRFYASYTLQ